MVKPKLRTYDNPPKEPTSLFFKSTTIFNCSKKTFFIRYCSLENRGKAPKCQQLSGNYFAGDFFPYGNRVLPEGGRRGSGKHLIRTKSGRRQRHRGFFIQHGPDRFSNVFEIKRLGQGGADSAALYAFFLQVKTLARA